LTDDLLMEARVTEELSLISAGQAEHEAGCENEAGKRLEHADGIEAADSLCRYGRFAPCSKISRYHAAAPASALISAMREDAMPMVE
jgi:hypothetical protein